MGVDRRFVLPLLGMIFAGAAMVALRGFTVDDALISARYAFHIANGHGARFNMSGAATDGVTPLVWPWLLAPMSKAGAVSGLAAAKWLGALGWLAAAGMLTLEIDRVAEHRIGWAHLSLIVVFGTPAVAAWAVSGMETGVAMALATGAVLCSRRPVAASALAGATALLRPEMVVWALIIGLASGFSRIRIEDAERKLPSPLQWALHLGLALGPFAVMCSVRQWAFGAVAPLALRAKPSDLHHGLVYVAASAIVTGPVIAVLAPIAWRRLPSWPRWLLAAFAAHALVVIGVGGDWMPMSRLLVPVLPSLGLVFASLARHSSLPSVIARIALCVAGQAFVVWRVGYDAAQVGANRARLIQALGPRLQSDDVVASLDIGWVGASFDGTVVDLAGLTDPTIASLPGGHTTKAIPPMLLADKGVRKMVLLLPTGVSAEEAWNQGRFARGVETRMAQMSWTRENFVPYGVVEANEGLRYLVVSAK